MAAVEATEGEEVPRAFCGLPPRSREAAEKEEWRRRCWGADGGGERIKEVEGEEESGDWDVCEKDVWVVGDGGVGRVPSLVAPCESCLS